MPAPLSLDLAIETPENVVLTHQLAGPAWRGAAYLVDYACRFAVFVLASCAAALFLMVLPGVTAGSMLLLGFLLEWGYFIGFESFWRGRTPGKWVCGLRVMHDNGQPLSWWGSVLRNLVRSADSLPLLLVYGEQLGGFGILLMMLVPVYGPAVVAMTLSPKLQRLGDLAARTVVVHERRARLPRDPVIYDHIQPLETGEINSFVPRSETLALIDQYLGRRSVLTYRRGHELASDLARVLADRLDYRGDLEAVKNYPMAFLARVYVTFAGLRDLEPAVAAKSGRRRRPLQEVSA